MKKQLKRGKEESEAVHNFITSFEAGVQDMLYVKKKKRDMGIKNLKLKQELETWEEREGPPSAPTVNASQHRGWGARGPPGSPMVLYHG